MREISSAEGEIFFRTLLFRNRINEGFLTKNRSDVTDIGKKVPTIFS